MTTAFVNRSDQLFGREVDIRRLCDRALQQGLTAIVARPLMGKTWMLTELARLLSEDGQYLIGYHESKGAESSHLLYAVSNLYSRWLEDSTMREQAISLWSRHKDGLVPRIGKMVGTLFEKLAAKPLESVGTIVGKAFDGLAEAQSDLLGGGLKIAPLPYDQALSLANLVANISGRRVILILDAWEKSPSLRSEFATLEAFLRHLDDWSPSHIFLAIRNPEVDSTQVNREAFERSGDLCRLSRAAEKYELGPIDTTNATEQKRITTFLRGKVNIAKDVAEHDLMHWIDGYPGVLNFWTSEARRRHMRSAQDLRDEAANAQSLRYIEFNHSLKDLKDDRRTLAARLAFFPRLDPDRWAVFERLLMRDITSTAFVELVDVGILIDDPVPTFGHDTRHVAARHWFVEHSKALIRRTGEELVEALAAGITGINPGSVPMFEALVACTEAANQVAMQGPPQCLIDAAHAAYQRTENICSPSFDQYYPQTLKRNGSFAVIISVALLIRGITREQRGDVEGAVADYTTVIELPGAPPELVAQALNNRGIAKGQRGDVEGELADYTTVVELPGAPPELVAQALYIRVITRRQRGDGEGAVADYTTVVELPGAPPEL
ncbi:MAG: hypothetical protein HY273_07915, partial [Gammaproteobacteria bacterium]|nr:hypothetical protein [Gammaproteobacteria bacterium]